MKSEVQIFTKSLDRYIDDDEYGELQAYLREYAESGKIVPGSGGVRKLRWAATGRRKRGGLRIIHVGSKRRLSSLRTLLRSKVRPARPYAGVRGFAAHPCGLRSATVEPDPRLIWN